MQLTNSGNNVGNSIARIRANFFDEKNSKYNSYTVHMCISCRYDFEK